MPKKNVTDAENVSSMCMELYLMLNSGVSLGEGFGLLSEDEPDKKRAAVLTSVYERMREGDSAASAMESAKAFPKYMTDMIAVGEKTGRLDTVLKSLSEYYDRQGKLSQSIKNAVIYPLLLLVMTIAVVAILITQVLPVFGEVYGQLGASMSPLAGGILAVGRALASWWPFILAGAIALALALAVLAKKHVIFTGKHMFKRTNNAIYAARLSSVLAMSMRSGLDTDDAMKLAERVIGKDNARADKLRECRKRMASGESFADALGGTGLFPASHVRMLAVGLRAGAADSVMEELARRSGDEAGTRIERMIGGIEPVMVAVMAVMVGVVLLSVMLPLLDIMSSIG